MNEKVNEVYKTNEYDMFEKIRGNRLISESNLSKLKFSMKQKYLEIPIIVNENKEVIDGQHRLLACQELNIPVTYIKIPGYNIDDVQRANMTSRRWTLEDRLNLYIQKGEESYVKIKEIINKYKLPIVPVLSIYARINGLSISEMRGIFEQGKFKLYEQELVDEFLIKLDDFSKYVNISRFSFISAFTELYFNQAFSYDHNIMLAKLPRYGITLNNNMSKGQFLDTLCNDIYSVGLTKNRICYNFRTGKFHR